ncbi:hypothetical protein JTE90_004530 [Oedothorax gibbosus]|uniref:RNA polymerase II subunit B1 CTD phosphatase RPAP2 homolog n=1 Tax=Oedothorax gibbosus TaxID=931172 RepID=A0AAV6VCQ4_9ARAC|nr:hypothetical protein JTE90_004530 [Oedothorax gibbosus]
MASAKPQRKAKSMTKEQKLEKAAREKRLSTTKERILGMKRDVLKIVESMLEKDLSNEWFLENCPKLCQQDYEDVIQERSIERLCGYPLCNKSIDKVIKQKYQISRLFNKVYDVTERKCFCCNECYKASNYLKAQLSEVPLHLRQAGMPINLHLISEKENSGSAGEEIVFKVSIDKNDIEKECNPTPATNLSKILKEDVKGMEEHLSKLEIKERTYEKPFVFGSKPEDKPVENDLDLAESHSESSDTDNNQEEGEDEPQNFPEYSNLSLLTNKHMPIPETNKKVVLIEPINKPWYKTVSESITLTSIDFISNVFYDWFTEDTLKYLIGERKLYAMKADHLFQTMVSSDSEELSTVKREYIDLCLKMDQLSDDEDSDLEEGKFNTTRDYMHKGDYVSIEQAIKDFEEKRQRKANKKKAVSFAPDVKDSQKEQTVESEEECEPNSSLPERTFPLVDSMSQNVLRRQVLNGKLKAVYFDVLPLVGLQYRDIRDGVKKIVETFSLTPTNITFKPKEWKCIALVLLRILTQNVLNDIEDAQYLKLSKNLLKFSKISVQDINKLATDLVSSKLLCRLQSCNK